MKHFFESRYFCSAVMRLFPGRSVLQWSIIHHCTLILTPLTSDPSFQCGFIPPLDINHKVVLPCPAPKANLAHTKWRDFITLLQALPSGCTNIIPEYWVVIEVDPAGPSVPALHMETGRRCTSLPDIGLEELSLIPCILIRWRLTDACCSRHWFHGVPAFPLAPSQATLRRVGTTCDRLVVLSGRR